MNDPPQHPSQQPTRPRIRGKGTYSRACAVCRRRKVKCDGVQPVCNPCSTFGRDCFWGSGTVKKHATQQQVETLRQHIVALEEYAAELKAQLEQYRSKYGDLASQESPLSPPPVSEDIQEEVDWGWESGSASEKDDIDELVFPTEHLKFEDLALQRFGPTSVFRLSSRVIEQATRIPEIFENRHLRYELVVPGIEPVSFNPNFDWSRNLPTEVSLTRKEHDRCLDLLFKFVTSWCLRIVPALFLRDMYRALSVSRSQTPPKTPHYSAMLHNALVAVALAFSDDPELCDMRSRQYFARKAKDYTETECQKPSLAVLHALSILGSFHSSQGDQTLGYMYFGMSGRMAQALGLSIDCSAWVDSGLISHEDMQDRNWGYWTTLTQDVCWSLYVGRDFCMALPEWHEISIPFVDSEFDQIPWYYPPCGLKPQPNCLSRIFAHTCELLLIARRIMDVVNGLSTPGNRHQVNHPLISKIDVELNAWQDHLGPEVSDTPSSRRTMLPHRLMLHISYWWLVILLHRPFYRPVRPMNATGKKIDHIKLCNRGADNLMSLYETWQSLYGLRYCPLTMIQTVFSAATIHLLSAAHAVSGPRLASVALRQSLRQLDLCRFYLAEIGRSHAGAQNVDDILSSLIQKQLMPRLMVRMAEANRVPRQMKPPSDSGTRSPSQTKQESPISPTVPTLPALSLFRTQDWSDLQMPIQSLEMKSQDLTYLQQQFASPTSEMMIGLPPADIGPGVPAGNPLAAQPFTPPFWGAETHSSSIGSVGEEMGMQYVDHHFAENQNSAFTEEELKEISLIFNFGSGSGSGSGSYGF